MASQTDNQIAFKLFWIKVNTENLACPKYKCKICNIERTKNKSGYTNLTSHLDDKHKNWKKVVKDAKSKSVTKGAIDKFLRRGAVLVPKIFIFFTRDFRKINLF